jgi:spore coat protein U-like protein
MMMKISRKIAAFAAVAALSATALPPTTWSAPPPNAFDTLQVTANVAAACSVTAQDLLFGNYDQSVPTAHTGSTDITVICTPTTSYEVALDNGVNSASCVSGNRCMTDGADYLSYDLLQSSGGPVWATGPDAQNYIATAGPATHTIYGVIPAGQFLPAGTYVDTIRVDVNF